MKSKFHDQNSESGASVTEVLIVIVIISIVAALAFMQMGTADTRFKRQNVARELKVAFERARIDSVKRRAQGAARANVTVNATSYVLQIDSNNDGTLESLTTDVAAGNILFAGSGSTTVPGTVYFDQRGEVATSGAGFQFLVCNASCATPTTSNANLLLVTLTGTVNILGGDASPPTFANANVGTIPPTTGINDLVRLP